LAEQYPAWWVDLLGEHNHVGGIDATRWLLERSRLAPGDRMLDCGAFVGASARLAATERGVDAVATDIAHDFLAAGRELEAGRAVRWVLADTRRLPFAAGVLASVWCLDSTLAPRELSRVAAPAATLCLSAEVPADGRGGFEAVLDEWAEFGWTLAAHRSTTLDALQAWRRAEAELVARRPRFEARYGTRPYHAQLDVLGDLVRGYERGGVGHGLFVFARG
jgi:hypothetical protein